MLSYKTKSVNKANANKKWLVVDADGQTLGRFSSKVAKILRGKHKPCYTPNADCGDYVIVINAEKVHLSGNKWTDKKYILHTGYPGGQREKIAKNLLSKAPEKVIERAVKGMLPKNKLGSQIFKNLKVVVGSNHTYAAQKPDYVNINEYK